MSFTADAATRAGQLRLSLSGTATDGRNIGKCRMKFGEFDLSGTHASSASRKHEVERVMGIEPT